MNEHLSCNQAQIVLRSAIITPNLALNRVRLFSDPHSADIEPHIHTHTRIRTCTVSETCKFGRPPGPGTYIKCINNELK